MYSTTRSPPSSDQYDGSLQGAYHGSWLRAVGPFGLHLPVLTQVMVSNSIPYVVVWLTYLVSCRAGSAIHWKNSGVSASTEGGAFITPCVVTEFCTFCLKILIRGSGDGGEIGA